MRGKVADDPLCTFSVLESALTEKSIILNSKIFLVSANLLIYTGVT